METRRKLRLPEMEGFQARWYAKQRGTEPQMALYRKQAAGLTASLPPGADVLEVAPGPGYHAIEVAKLGFTVTGLDIGATMVEIAAEGARRASVRAEFRHGDASAMPFEDESFDLIVCQAAFKNFRQPVTALNEMHRVLRPGGVAVVQDMNHDTTDADIDREVAGMNLGTFGRFAVRQALGGLRRRAFTRAQFEAMATESAFGGCTVIADGIGFEARLTR